jgi:branched-chain amino acid transport system substrate-binding protein
LATSIPSASNVYSAWAKTVNASGGISGHPVQLIVKDDTGNPGTSVSNIQALLSDGVIAINDLSLVDEPWASTVQKANIPVVGSNAIEAPFYTNPDFYASGQTNDSTTYSLVAAAKSAGATSVGDLYCAEAAVCQALVGLTKTAAQKVGIAFSYGASAAATAPNYTAQCVAAKEAKVQALILNLTGPTAERFAEDCDRQGYDPTYILESSGVNVGQFTTPGLEKSLWMAFSDYPFVINSPSVNAMNAAIDKYYPGLRNTPLYSGFAEQAWAGGLLLQDGFKAAGLTASATPTSSALIQGLESLKNDTLGGFTPPLTFEAGKPHPVDCWFTAKVINGQVTVANNGQVTCESGSAS